MTTLRLGSFGYDTSSDKAFSFEGLVVLEQTATSLIGDLRRAGKPNVAVQMTGQFEKVTGSYPVINASISSIRTTVDGALLYEIVGAPISSIGHSRISPTDGNLYAFQKVTSQIAFYGNDVLQGGSGNDILQAWWGNNVLVGNEGYDTAAISANRGTVTAVRWEGEALIARCSQQEMDRLSSIEALRFADGTVALADLPQFRLMQYLASHADLTAAFGTDQNQAWRHFFDHGSVEQRQITFSGHSYLASYGDLRTAYGTDAEAAARHYLLYGRVEGRTITFDAVQYLASNADLRAAYGTDGDRAALHHLQYGAAEGRVTSFDGLRYIASNSDLIRILPHTAQAGAMHFIQSGASAGRSVSFDSLCYIASNRDLMTALGANEARGVQHWLSSGFTEGRRTTLFDAGQYLETYADLRAAFGTDARAATVHWIETGADEGRTGFYERPQWYGSYGGSFSTVGAVANFQAANFHAASGTTSPSTAQEVTPV